MLQLNGVSLPPPSSLSVRVMPRAGTAEYNSLGNLVQDGVKEKRTVEIGWVRISLADLAVLAAQLSPGGFITLTYPDPLSGSREMHCRAAGQSARVYRCRDGAPQWADVTLTLEER